MSERAEGYAFEADVRTVTVPEPLNRDAVVTGLTVEYRWEEASQELADDVRTWKDQTPSVSSLTINRSS